MIDRRACAYPVIRTTVEPCGVAAGVASDESAHEFAYCQEHGAKVLALLRVEVAVDLREGRAAAEKRQRLHALEVALERA